MISDHLWTCPTCELTEQVAGPADRRRIQREHAATHRGRTEPMGLPHACAGCSVLGGPTPCSWPACAAGRAA